MQELPGVGKRYDLAFGQGGQRLSVVVRRDGTRDLYAFAERGDDEPAAVIELTEEQARILAAVLSATFFDD
ncbi:potassium transporter TrkA [Asanoa iriomotensis]|uniref:Potassium/proton antiporter subunit KhtT-like N-terminal domain-containing protein n=1 Tax=Asanoa iriomotensis TaxID=234613 RepID=A0ABQ4CD43_9ACTN|nr:potassium transporter TrkA [Asanoa iriomotensis]GIF60681.1 hypothetical protein Air01nite_67760 [Asanoa iriomotensis]